MSWCKELFGHEKPVIALLHLNAFPGDPLYKKGDSMKKTVEDARRDLHALQDGGVDGILFSNEFSLPYQSDVDPVQPCGMARHWRIDERNHCALRHRSGVRPHGSA